MIETIIEAVARQARSRPDAPALADDRARLTWSEAKAWVDRAAGWLIKSGFPRGAPVLGWLPNCVEWYLLRFACEQAGMLWVPVPASLGQREFSSIAERVRPVVLFMRTHFRDRDYSAESVQALSRLNLDTLRIAVPDGALLQLEAAPADTHAALRLEELSHALPTSGSEGIPKLALYTLGAACERAHVQADLLRLEPKDVVLVLSSGTGPAKVGWLAAPVAGASVLALSAFGIERALSLIERERATIVCGTPAQLAILAAKFGSTDVSSVRVWYTAGSVLPITLAEDLESRTCGIVVSTYGGTDFGGWASPALDDPPAVRHHTVGVPRAGTEFRIVGPNGRDVPAGEKGELIGKGRCSVSGFLGEQGRDRWQDGWFHTGDLARLDESGNIVIVGRLSEVIIRGGDNVNPVEVESLLRTHPAVAQVAVIGVPDPVLGERICACVVPAPQNQSLDLDALRKYVRDQGLTQYKAPERLVILDSLPIVGDKIDRRALMAICARAASCE